MAKKGVLERLKEGVVLGDGGYVLELERRGYVQAGPFTPEVAIEHPEALRQLHREFLRAGTDVLQALTFYASKDKLETAGYVDQVEVINRAAVRVANEVAGDETLVAGTLSLTWMYDPDDPGSRDRVRRLFEEQVALQTAEGVDFFICETFVYLEEARLALRAVKDAGYPAMVTFTLREAQSKEGTPIGEIARILVGEGADIVGANCGLDPEHMLPIVEVMRKAVAGYVAAQPIGFRTRDDLPHFTQLPEFPLALDPLTLTRDDMADYARRARDMGINYIGSCCGSVAHHVRAMAEALGRKPPASAKSADLGRHPGVQKTRTLDEMAGRKPRSADAPRFGAGGKSW
ncbi:MAG: homocysteine S-methyltransferase family protein [Candidatus Rokuibacteriota bacterium]